MTSTFRKIVRYVLCIHAIFLGIILLGSPLPSRKEKKPLIVKTVTPKMAAPVVAQVTPKAVSKPPPVSIPPPPKPKPVTPIQPKNPPVLKKAPPAPKKEPAIADKQIKKNAPVPQKKNLPDNRAKISDALKQQLQESIAQMEGKKQSPISKRPVSIQLNIDAVDQSSSESQFFERMVAYLHQALHLPEFGEVKIQLTLRQDGSIAKLVILSSESENNKRYLESNLPRLHLPGCDQPEQTFVLTFCNEI